MCQNETGGITDLDIIASAKELNDKIRCGSKVACYVLFLVTLGTVIGCSEVLPAQAIDPGITTPYIELFFNLLKMVTVSSLSYTLSVHTDTVLATMIADKQ